MGRHYLMTPLSKARSEGLCPCNRATKNAIAKMLESSLLCWYCTLSTVILSLPLFLLTKDVVCFVTNKGIFPENKLTCNFILAGSKQPVFQTRTQWWLTVYRICPKSSLWMEKLKTGPSDVCSMPFAWGKQNASTHQMLLSCCPAQQVRNVPALVKVLLFLTANKLAIRRFYVNVARRCCIIPCWSRINVVMPFIY